MLVLVLVCGRSFHKEALHLMLLLVNELAGCPIFVAADVAVASRRCERAAADQACCVCARGVVAVNEITSKRRQHQRALSLGGPAVQQV